MLGKSSQILVLCPKYNFAFGIVVLHVLLNLFFLPFFFLKQQKMVMLNLKIKS